MDNLEGMLLVDKPQGRTSFSLIHALRKLTGVKKIGHTGTLDPFATGVMILLLGRAYTRFSDKLLLEDKEYDAKVTLGVSTDTYDCDGKIVARSKKKPTLTQIEDVLSFFQGEIEQIPPMFSAKKIGGKKLYSLARAGQIIDRDPARVRVKTELLNYTYPNLHLKIACSKGTYIRSIAHEIGEKLRACAHLGQLKRTRSGLFTIDQCLDGNLLYQDAFDIRPYLNHSFNESFIKT
ncbi:MAG: tRNA pseudouridine(55) synthase TruB [Chlamydiia bacterium]|nr:tRNA pseudouridine(55) synthase TruB [Chlamydiia bacterium]